MVGKLEYRLVIKRPEGQDGRPQRYVNYKTYAKASKGLADFDRNMDRYREAGIAVWTAHLEEREVVPWREV